MMKKELLQRALNKEEEQILEENPVPPSPPRLMPNDLIMNPLLSIHTMVDDLALEITDLKTTTKKNEDLLSAILDRETRILNEELAEADEGGVLRKRGTASKTKFFFVDCTKDPGHKVKGIIIKNDGPSTVFAGFNAPINPEVDADIVDIRSDQSRFEEMLNGESIKFRYNRNKIQSIHILTDPASLLADSQVRVWLLW